MYRCLVKNILISGENILVVISKELEQFSNSHKAFKLFPSKLLTVKMTLLCPSTRWQTSIVLFNVTEKRPVVKLTLNCKGYEDLQRVIAPHWLFSIWWNKQVKEKYIFAQAHEQILLFLRVDIGGTNVILRHNDEKLMCVWEGV